MSTRTGISFLTGRSAGMAGQFRNRRAWPEWFRKSWSRCPGLRARNGNLFVMGGLAGKLDLQIGMDRRGERGCFRQPSAHGDHGKLRPARHLKHVQIAVAVPRIKGLDGHGDQKIALPGVADAFASRRMAYALALMQRVRDMVGEGGLFQNPLAICCQRRNASRRKRPVIFSFS